MLYIIYETYVMKHMLIYWPNKSIKINRSEKIKYKRIYFIIINMISNCILHLLLQYKIPFFTKI